MIAKQNDYEPTPERITSEPGDGCAASEADDGAHKETVLPAVVEAGEIAGHESDDRAEIG
jgi:hypothetical protein